MERAVQVIWWIGLLGALVATLAILKEVSLVLRALRDIHELARIIRDAARGVASNLQQARRLPDLQPPSAELRRTTASLAAAATSIERKLAALSPAAARRGG